MFPLKRLARQAMMITALLAGSGTASAQSASPGEATFVMPLVPGQAPKAVTMPAPASSGIQQAQCTSCGTGESLFPSSAPLTGSMGTTAGILGYGRRGIGESTCDLGCTDAGCGEAGCVAGRTPCTTCTGFGPISKLACAFRNALNCPDPCYEAKWIAGQNAALFLDSARPVTQTRIRWTTAKMSSGRIAANTSGAGIGARGPALVETGVNYNTLNFYTEAAIDRFSFFVNLQYRNVNGSVNGGAGGFGDMSLGTKSVLVDSELALLTFQLTTFIPTGVASRGTGTGHVSLEPALLSSVKLTSTTWWQSQVGYWAPLAGSPGRAGGVFQFYNSINHLLFSPMTDMHVFGLIETQGLSFTSGSVTLPGLGVVPANRTTIFTLGPSVRLAFTDKLDFGFGMQFAVTTPRLAAQQYRTELRWRF